MASRHICPKCGSKRFIVTAHVTQDWVVDEVGTWIATSEDCVEVTHKPDDDDVWNCANCGDEAIVAKKRPPETTFVEDALVMELALFAGNMWGKEEILIENYDDLKSTIDDVLYDLYENGSQEDAFVAFERLLLERYRR